MNICPATCGWFVKHLRQCRVTGLTFPPSAVLGPRSLPPSSARGEVGDGGARQGKEWVFLELVIGRWTTVCHWLATWTIRRTELTRGVMGRSPGYLGRASVSDNYIKNGSSAGRAWSRDEQSHVTQLWWPGPSTVELGHVTSPAVQCTEPTHHRISRVSPTPSLSLLDHVSHLANGLS